MNTNKSKCLLQYANEILANLIYKSCIQMIDQSRDKLQGLRELTNQRAI